MQAILVILEINDLKLEDKSNAQYYVCLMRAVVDCVCLFQVCSFIFICMHITTYNDVVRVIVDIEPGGLSKPSRD